MEKGKLLIAIGLSVALMMFPLAGMAGNPLPINDSTDGHPWDDGDNTDVPADSSDTLTDVCKASIGKDNDRPLRCSARFFVVSKWYLLLIW